MNEVTQPIEAIAVARATSAPALDRGALMDSIVERLTAMYVRRHRAKRSRLARQGVSMTHYYILLHLAEGEELTMTALAHSLEASLPSMTGIVDRIESRGLVERMRSPDDRRVVKVRITEAGREWLRETEALRRDKMERVLGHIDDVRLRRLAASLGDLMTAFAAAEACGDLDAAEPADHGAIEHDAPAQKENLAP